jgi:hypothetical protein
MQAKFIEASLIRLIPEYLGFCLPTPPGGCDLQNPPRPAGTAWRWNQASVSQERLARSPQRASHNVTPPSPLPSRVSAEATLDVVLPETQTQVLRGLKPTYEW